MSDTINRIIIKKNAKDIFYNENNRLKLIFSGLIPMLVFTSALILLLSLIDGLSVLIEHFNLIDIDFYYLYDIAYPVVLIITLPSLWGYSYVIKKAVINEDYTVSDVFIYYRSIKAFLKAVLASVIALLPFILLGVMAYFMFYANNMLYEYMVSLLEYDYVASIVNVAIAIVIIMVILLLIIPTASMYSYIALCTDEDLRVFKSIPKALALSRGRYFEIMKFILSFAGYVALSAVTFGVMYIIFAMPYMWISYMGYVNAMQEEKDKKTNRVELNTITEEMNTINE